MTASAGSDAIVYEQAGYIYLLDAKSGKAQRLDVQVTGDLPWARAQFKGNQHDSELGPVADRRACGLRSAR